MASRKRRAFVSKAERKPLPSPWPPDGRRVAAILRILDRTYPDAGCELDHRDPFQLLCSTILSAQCTDERVNRITPALFRSYPTPQAMAEAPPHLLEDLIRPTGFFRNKARSLLGSSRAIVARHAGRVPRTMTELLELPGVARKTANVVLGTAYRLAEGVVVDTHVQRVSLRLALTRHTTPARIEQDLQSVLPRPRWIQFSHQIIWHGRRVCFARQPNCEHCPLVPHCPGSFRES